MEEERTCAFCITPFGRVTSLVYMEPLRDSPASFAATPAIFVQTVPFPDGKAWERI
jgi:hypothetical protein